MRTLFSRFFAIAVVIATSSCATYGPSTFWGGYDDKEIDPGVWKVTGSSNAASGGEPFTHAMVYYRSAEIAEAHGFSHIRVLDGLSWDYPLLLASTSTYVAYKTSGGPGYSELVFRGASGPDDVTGCRTKRVEICATLSVHELKRTLASKVGLPPP